MDILRAYPMVAILLDEGYDISHKGRMYHSPWRPDKNRSLKIDDISHRFVDYGDTNPRHVKDKNRCAGGDTFDFLSILFFDTVYKSLSPEQKERVEDYLSSRSPGIGPSWTRDASGREPSRRGPLVGYVNHSGGAKGADTAWDELGAELGVVSEHYYYGDKTPNGNHPISREAFLEGRERVLLANRTLARNPDRYMSLLARNWMQVKNADALYAIGHFAPGGHGIVDGGTGWAVQMAIDAGDKDVFLFDQNSCRWYQWDRRGGESRGWSMLESAPVLTKNFAGIGSRSLTDAGFEAIRACYDATVRSLGKERSEGVSPVIDDSLPSLDIWAAGGPNAVLSNMAPRPFTVGLNTFPSVEHWFQWSKARFAGDAAMSGRILASADPYEARRLGRAVSGLDAAEWQRRAAGIMEYGIRLSFLSNPEAAYALLKTGHARLTHKNDPGRWSRDFPEILMRVRELLYDSVGGDIESYRSSKRYVVDEVRDGISWEPLRRYMCEERCINESVLIRYCSEVKVHMEEVSADGGSNAAHQGIIAVGFPNRSGGYELRKEPYVNAGGQTVEGMKQCTDKDITVVDARGRFRKEDYCPEAGGRVLVFEGFTDFLSYLCWNGIVRPGCDCVILNSTSMYRTALEFLAKYDEVVCFLDNDKSGREATKDIASSLRRMASDRGRSVRVMDGSDAYEGYNDINEAWQSVCGVSKDGDARDDEGLDNDDSLSM